MKITIVDPWYFTPPYDHELSAGLSRLGHDVTLISQTRDEWDAATKTIPSTVTLLKLFSAPPAYLPRFVALVVKGLQHIRGMSKLYAAIYRNPPDVIHFQWLPLPLIDMLFLPFLRRIAPLILTIHDSNPYHGAGPWLLRAGNMVAIRRCDHLIVHNELSERRMVDRGIPAERLHRVAHGLLNQSDMAADKVVDDHSDRVHFLQFGKIKEYKGVDVLLMALAQLKPELRKRCRVSIVGRAYVDTHSLSDLITRHDLRETVDLRFDFVSDSDMANLFDTADFLVLPYRSIDTSGVLMAAISRGVPVVASAIGCFAEMLTNGEEALLVPPDDSKALAKALETLIRSPGASRRMCKRMLALQQSIPSWDSIAETTTEVYQLAQSSPVSESSSDAVSTLLDRSCNVGVGSPRATSRRPNR